MIAILSHEQLEMATEEVMDWLRSWDIPCIRVNGSDIDCEGGPLIRLSKSDVRLRLNIDGVEIDPSEIKVVWFRRWAYKNKYRQVGLFRDESHRSDGNICRAFAHMYDELRSVSDLIFSLFTSAKWLGTPGVGSVNKLLTLKKAASLGLDIPTTLITTRPEEAYNFAEEHG